MAKLAACLLLAAAIGVTYYNALGNGFVFDDYLVVVNQPAIPAIASDPAQAFSPAVLGRHRPLRTLSYVLDYRLGGMQPWVFHLSNVVYHWITSCLVFLVALRLVANNAVVSGQLPVADLSQSAIRNPQSAILPALFVALLWALHPIQTDAVTYIAGRRDILAALFFFLGFYAFLRLRSPESGVRTGGRWVWAGVVFLAYLLGLLSKEMAATLPLVMLCYDSVSAVRPERVRFGWGSIKELSCGVARAVRGHIYLYVPLLLSGAVFSWYAAFVVLPSSQIGWYGGSITTNFLTVARIWVYYLYLLLWPVRLLADYTGAFSVTRSVLDPVALLAVGFLFLLFLLLLGTLRRSRLVAFAGLWIAITLLPVSHLIPFPEMMAEHYLYLPSFGFCLLVALAFTRLMESPQSTIHNPELGLQTTDNWQLTTGNWWRVAMGGGLLMALLTFYAARTVIRNRDWRDDLTFYVRVVGDNPYSARARLGLGYAYDRSGLPRLAVVQYQAGLRIDPQDPRLYTNMGAAYQKLKMLAEAEKAYLTALQLCPQDSATLNNLGFLYTEQGEFDKARSSLEQAERLSRGRDPAVYANFGLLHELSGKLPEALKAYRKARALTPANSFLSGKIAALEKQLSS